MNRTKIVVDDLRMAPEGWLLFKNPEEFIAWRRENPDEVIDVLALDHDMGEDPDGELYMSGYDLVQYLIEVDSMNAHLINRFQFHTDNPIGFKNMHAYLISARKHNIIPAETKIIDEKMNLIDGHMSFSGYTWK